MNTYGCQFSLDQSGVASGNDMIEVNVEVKLLMNKVCILDFVNLEKQNPSTQEG